MRSMDTLAQAVEAHARKTPEATALVDAPTGARTTDAALARRSAARAEALAGRHVVGRGTRVAVLAHNDVLTFELLVACSSLGAVLVPLNTRLADAELDVVLARARPQLLVVDEAHLARLPGHPRLHRLDLARYATADAERPLARDGLLHEPRIMLFTSGTTGQPKGALLTEASVAANAASTAQAWGLTSADVALVDAPLFHTGGLNVLATPLLYAGGTVVVAPRFDAQASGEALCTYGATVAFGVPTMLERFLATGVVATSRVRLWVTGGAPCPLPLLEAFETRGARLVQGFGMTECGPNCFRPLEGAARGSIGMPTHGIEARLVDDVGRDVPPGQAGELWLRGPHVFAGYFEDEAASRAALDAEGWLHTGDVLRATPEGWWVAGRKKEMFISGGENVYPAEVEAALLAHPAVAEAAVIGVPDARWGEAGVAFVRAHDAASAPSAEDLRASVRTRLAGYKVPREVFVRAELPRTASNKVDKQALRRTVGVSSAADPQAR
jgi:fatty-acyl-CoA synthase